MQKTVDILIVATDETWARAYEPESINLIARAYEPESINLIAPASLAAFTVILTGTQSGAGYADCGIRLGECDSYAHAVPQDKLSQRRLLSPISTELFVFRYAEQTFMYIAKQSPYRVA
ncbi:hypothetical protein TNCV_5117711 [Trichonephila clavipes]|nr:hypothetical protein TNCV_5117711 [Trichonephila clavipes]